MYESKRVTKSNSSFSKGNLSNQKYEALWNITHHFQTVANASPTKETSRWKDSDDFQVIKHQGKRQLLDKNVEKSNFELAHRMYDVFTEQRAKTSKEYIPGFRVGRGGTVIDCYESSCQRFYEYKIETKRKVRAIREKKIQNDNTFIAKYIGAARSSCDRKDLEKSYEQNRVLYNFLATRTPHTALHLGLLEKAKFEFYKGTVRRISSPKSRALSNYVPDPEILQEASAEDVLLNDPPLRHVSSKLQLNTSRGGDYVQKLQPMFTECARYTSISRPTRKRNTGNDLPAQSAPHDSANEIIDAEISDYIPDGGPVQGLRKLQALRQQRDMQQQQSPPGIVQEESQTLSHWSDLCAEVDAEMVLGDDQQRRELDAAGELLDKQSTTVKPSLIEVDECAAMEQLPPELLEELGPELSMLYGTLFARKAALDLLRQDYEDREVNESPGEGPQVDQQLSFVEDPVVQEPDLDNKIVEHDVDTVAASEKDFPVLGVVTGEESLQSLGSSATKKRSIASPFARNRRRAAMALVSVNTHKDSRFLFEGENSLVEMSMKHTMDSVSYSYHVRGFMSNGEPYYLRNEQKEIDNFEEEIASTRERSDSATDIVNRNRRTWISMNMKRGASTWASLVRDNPLLSPLWEDDRGRRKPALRLIPRSSLLCQCAMLPPFRSSEGGSGPTLNIKQLSENRVDAFMLNIMDVGFRLPGSSKPSANMVDLAANSLSGCEHSSLNPIPYNLGSEEEPPDVEIDESESNRYTLSASTGILVELVPILRTGLDVDPAADDSNKDASSERTEKALYCWKFLSVRELIDRSKSYGYSDLHCTLSDLLHYPLDVMDGRGPPLPRRASSISFDSKANSQYHSSAQSSNSTSKSADGTDTGNAARSILYSSLPTVFDTESEKHLFEMISKSLYVAYSPTHHNNCEIKFT